MKNYVLILTLGLIALGAGYFVFIYRPQQIKVKCMQIATFESKTESRFGGVEIEGKNYSDKVYRDCLNEAGIK